MILHREAIAVRPGAFLQMPTELPAGTPPTRAQAQSTGPDQNRYKQSGNWRVWNSRQKKHMP